MNYTYNNRITQITLFQDKCLFLTSRKMYTCKSWYIFKLVKSKTNYKYIDFSNMFD